MSQFLLEANGIKKSFGSLKAVDGIDVSIAPGECLALLGPNGAGKTTFVEILEGLGKADEGTVKIFGKDLKKFRQEIQEEVGVLLQETYLYKKMTISETLQLFASFFKSSANIDEIIQLLELEEKKDTHLEKLSGGQRQRVYLGCAFINNPKLVFLDEPTTGLDPQARRKIWDLLKQYKSDNKSVLLTTHYMDEAEQLADRVAIIDQGKIIAEGTPRELIVKNCGQEILWVQISGSADEISQLRQTEKIFEQAIEKDHGWEFQTTNAAELINTITSVCNAAKLNICNLQMRSSTLEDVFLKLTGRSIRDA